MKKALDLVEAGSSSSDKEQSLIKIFSFGEAKGVMNLLPNLDTINEDWAPP